MDDGPGPIRAARALRRSLHRLPPEFTLSVYVTLAIRVEPVESLAGPRALAMHF
jgi:hypothetical protein